MFLGEKLKYIAFAIFTAAAGAQCVHLIYKPMANFPDMVEKEKARIRRKISDNKTEGS